MYFAASVWCSHSYFWCVCRMKPSGPLWSGLALGNSGALGQTTWDLSPMWCGVTSTSGLCWLNCLQLQGPQLSWQDLFKLTPRGCRRAELAAGEALELWHRQAGRVARSLDVKTDSPHFLGCSKLNVIVWGTDSTVSFVWFCLWSVVSVLRLLPTALVLVFLTQEAQGGGHTASTDIGESKEKEWLPWNLEIKLLKLRHSAFVRTQEDFCPSLTTCSCSSSAVEVWNLFCTQLVWSRTGTQRPKPTALSSPPERRIIPLHL